MPKRASYILWLPSWFPNIEDRFDGDFIQRHAYAAATENDIHVLFIKPIQQEFGKKEAVHCMGRLTEQTIYIKKEHGLLKKFVRQAMWFQTYTAAIRKLVEEKGLPRLVHVHVPWRAGLIALWMKKTFGIPYVITEHWDIYNEVVADRFSCQPWWLQQLIKTIYRKAEEVIPVSAFIGNAINKYVVPKKYKIVSNVVDTNLFRYKGVKPDTFTFLHVSNMVPKKNVGGILESFKLLQQGGADVQLVLVGNRDDTYVKYAEALNLDKGCVLFKGEIPYADVASEMQSAHCLIMNSIMENAPCVISEALCCGTPVIATAVGGIPELTDQTNSILIPSGDTAALVAAMKRMYEDFKKFDAEAIAAAATARFGEDAIAKQFTILYTNVIT